MYAYQPGKFIANALQNMKVNTGFECIYNAALRKCVDEKICKQISAFLQSRIVKNRHSREANHILQPKWMLTRRGTHFQSSMGVDDSLIQQIVAKLCKKVNLLTIRLRSISTIVACIIQNRQIDKLLLDMTVSANALRTSMVYCALSFYRDLPFTSVHF